MEGALEAAKRGAIAFCKEILRWDPTCAINVAPFDSYAFEDGTASSDFDTLASAISAISTESPSSISQFNLPAALRQGEMILRFQPGLSVRAVIVVTNGLPDSSANAEAYRNDSFGQKA